MSSLSLREKSLAYYKCIIKSEYYESGWKYFNTLSLNEPMGDNFVTVHFNGRLGNVFCQLATLIAYAEEFKMNISICQQKEPTTREQVCGVVIYPELFAPIYKDVFKGYYEKFFEIFSEGSKFRVRSRVEGRHSMAKARNHSGFRAFKVPGG